MNAEAFAAKVASLERSARDNPRAYKARVVALALAGYGYLAAVLAFLCSLLAVAIASIVFLKVLGVKIAIAIGAFLWMVAKALWVRFPAPEGIEITAREAPALFAMIERLRKRLDAQRFHHVLVTDEFNAAVAQRPRLGLFGWYRNYLLVGLPLMKALTPQQLEAVIAHELGHLAGGHGRLSGWIYRLRAAWGRLLDALERQESAGTFLFKPFARLYAPYFNAYSYPLARANEFEADAAAARLTSPKVAAEALCNVEVAGAYLGERYWPEVHRKADDLPQPAFAPFAGMGRPMVDGIATDDARAWLEQALARTTTLDDTHPCLAERLAALGQNPRPWPPLPGRAADTLLGEALEAITQRFDSGWKDGIAPAWSERHRTVSEGRARLAQLDAARELSYEQAAERASLTEAFGAGAAAAEQQYERLRELAPDAPLFLFHCGRLRLARDDASGAPLLERALSLDPDAVMSVAPLLRDFHWRHGRKEEAHAWHERLEREAHRRELAERERTVLGPGDKLDPHGLDAGTIARISAELKAIPGVRKAWLARKRLEHFPEQPLLVLAFVSTPWWRGTNAKLGAQVLEAVSRGVALPHRGQIVWVEGDSAFYRSKFRFKRGARIV